MEMLQPCLNVLLAARKGMMRLSNHGQATQSIAFRIRQDGKMDNHIIKLDGANMDIDLASPEDQIAWSQDPCPWNASEDTSEHKCAVKNISICPYFCGIEYDDFVLYCYPHENPLRNLEEG
jgi:hypothetical protein